MVRPTDPNPRDDSRWHGATSVAPTSRASCSGHSASGGVQPDAWTPYIRLRRVGRHPFRRNRRREAAPGPPPANSQPQGMTESGEAGLRGVRSSWSRHPAASCSRPPPGASIRDRPRAGRGRRCRRGARSARLGGHLRLSRPLGARALRLRHRLPPRTANSSGRCCASAHVHVHPWERCANWTSGPRQVLNPAITKWIYQDRRDATAL